MVRRHFLAWLGTLAVTPAARLVASTQGRRGRQQALDDLLEQAGRYVLQYERAFWLLALDEFTEQWLERPNNPGSNLSRSNPGGGMLTGGLRAKHIIKSEYVLVAAGEGRGWVPFRDVVSVDGKERRFPDERVVRMFRSGNEDAFDLASQLHDESRQYDLGTVTRTINIPMLGLSLLHPEIRERFTFKHEAEETMAGRSVVRVSYRESYKPTLIKTYRGRDLALTGRMWIEPETGVVVKTDMTAADPAVRAVVTVTFRRDGEIGFWVPERMEEYYKANLALDDIFAVSTFSTPRVYQAGFR